LREVGAYSIAHWGIAQADRYLARLEDHAQKLADIPTLGRRCERIRPGLWRSEVASHVMFFRREPKMGVLVCRILHRRMLPEAHPIDDDE
jgi:toxin ParE1/3/4